ncbi:hypothetical protein D3C71_1669680 [compost metagenome]
MQAFFQRLYQLRGLCTFCVGDLAVVGEDPLQGLLCLECRQHGFQCVIHRQHVGDAAAGGDRQHDLVGQGAFGQQVQQSLQCTGKRSLVHRGGNDQAIGLGYQLLEVLHMRAVETGVQQVFGGKVTYLERHNFNAPALQPLARTLQQHAGA